MNKIQQRWLLAGILLLVVIVGILGFGTDQRPSWGFWLLCAVIGIVGGTGLIRIWGYGRFIWNRASTGRKWAAAIALLLITVGAALIADLHQTDTQSRDIEDVLAICLGFLFWGLYLLFSKTMDRLYARFTRR